MERHSPLGSFLRYAAHSVLGMLGLSCYILADTYFISLGVGVRGLTALNLAIPVYSLVHGVGLMLGMGGATRYAIARSRSDPEDSDRIFTGTMWLAAGFSILFVLAGAFLSGPLARLTGADPEVFEMTRTYLRVILLFSPAFMLNDIMVCFVRNDGEPRLAMTGMLTGSLANILMDYVLIFPLGLGILGAVLATGFAPLISLLVMWSHRARRRNGFHLIRVGLRKFRTLRTFSLGFPALVSEVSSGLVILVFNFLILGLAGNIGVAAYGVVANLSLVVLAIFTGLAQGLQPLVSRAHGQGDPGLAKRLLRYALITAALLSLVFYLGLALFADPIAGIFNSGHDPQLQPIAVQGIRLYFLAIPFAGFNLVWSTHLTSTERPRPAHGISLARGMLLIVPLAWLLSRAVGITGVWLAFPVTEAMVALAAVILLRWRDRRSLILR